MHQQTMRAIGRLETRTYTSPGCSGSQRSRGALGSNSSSGSSPVCAICLEEFMDGQVSRHTDLSILLQKGILFFEFIFLCSSHRICGSSLALMSFIRSVWTLGSYSTAHARCACTTSWVNLRVRDCFIVIQHFCLALCS